MKSKIIILLLAANILYGQDKSYLFSAFSLASNYFEIPSFGLGHYLQKEYGTGSIFTVTEGLGVFFYSKKFEHQLDTLKYPNISNADFVYKSGIKGISPETFSNFYTRYLIRSSTMMVKDVDNFLAFRKFWVDENRSQSISQSKLLNLASSPFQTKYLKEPEVFLPLAIAITASLFEDSKGKSFFDSKSINIFNKDFSSFEGGTLKIISDYALLTLVAMSEEMLFRGTIQTGLSEAVNPNFGLIASSILFGLIHLKNHNLIYSIRATIAGLYLGWQYQKYNNNLGRVIALHFQLDFIPSIISFFKSPAQSNGIYRVGY